MIKIPKKIANDSRGQAISAKMAQKEEGMPTKKMRSGKVMDAKKNHDIMRKALNSKKNSRQKS